MMGFNEARNNDGIVGLGEFGLMGFAALYPFYNGLRASHAEAAKRERPLTDAETRRCV